MEDFKFGVTAEQIAKWKADHGDIYLVSATTESGHEQGCYLRKPDRVTRAAVYSAISESKVAAGEIVIANCYLGGDPVDMLKQDAEVYDTLCLQAQETVRFLVGTTKKL